MSYKRKIFKLTFFTALLFSVFYIFNFVTDKKDALANINTKQVVEVFKTPSCGCCYGYVLFLEEEKFKVKQTDMRSLHTIKQKYNIPVEMQSCHTTIIGKYFIEGHVPFEAVNKLKAVYDVIILFGPGEKAVAIPNKINGKICILI